MDLLKNSKRKYFPNPQQNTLLGRPYYMFGERLLIWLLDTFIDLTQNMKKEKYT